MLLEEKTDRLFNAVYKKNKLNVYDFCAGEWMDDNEIVVDCKVMADELVNEKLARYTDEGKTEMSITNYGRYWMAHGGYFIYLKEGEKKIKSKRDKHNEEWDKHNEEWDKHNEELSEELKEARLKFTHYRIVTYWWSFILTIISFLLSMLNLYLILKK